MDPNETLKILRQLARLILDGDDDYIDCVALAEKFNALDEWISKGGFLPENWE